MTIQEPIAPPLPHNLDAEKMVLGAILIDNRALRDARQLLAPEDFYLSQHIHIFDHMLALAKANSVIDFVTLSERLSAENELELIGGAGYLASLADGIPRISHVEYHARIVKDNAQRRRAIHCAEAIQRAAFDREDVAEIQKRFVSTAEQLQPANQHIRTVTAKDLCAMEVRHREFLLEPLLTTRSMGEIYAWRGLGKTMVALSIGHAVGSGGTFLKYRAPKAARTLYVDGELDEGTLQERAKLVGADQNENLEFLCVDMLDEPMPHLATGKAQQIIEDKLDGKQLLILDNLTALAPSTNDTEAQDWMSIQAWLLNLRKHGIASIFLNHAGHAGWSRGTTRREDLLDWVMKLEHPKDYDESEGLRVELRFTKTRAFMGAAAHPVEAKFTTDPHGQHIWTVANIEQARLGQIIELRNSKTSWREIEALTGIPRSTAQRLWRDRASKPEMTAS